MAAAYSYNDAQAWRLSWPTADFLATPLLLRTLLARGQTGWVRPAAMLMRYSLRPARLFRVVARRPMVTHKAAVIDQACLTIRVYASQRRVSKLRSSYAAWIALASQLEAMTLQLLYKQSGGSKAAYCMHYWSCLTVVSSTSVLPCQSGRRRCHSARLLDPGNISVFFKTVVS